MFMDVGIGALCAIFSSAIFDVQLSGGMVLFAVFFALAPDFDFLYFNSRTKDTKFDYKHRDYIHYPLIFLPVGTVLVWVILGKVYAVIFLLSSFFHFVHDSIGIGWGVKWLFPFSKNNFAFFYLYSKKRKRGLRKMIFSFSPKQLPKYVRVHGDANWVRNIYYKWHPIAIFEFSFFLFSLSLLFFYVR